MKKSGSEKRHNSGCKCFISISLGPNLPRAERTRRGGGALFLVPSRWGEGAQPTRFQLVAHKSLEGPRPQDSQRVSRCPPRWPARPGGDQPLLSLLFRAQN